MNLLDFCKDAFREEIRQPVNFGEHTYVTDGRIGLRVARDPQYQEAPENYKWPKQLGLWIDAEMMSASLSPLPAYQDPPLERCHDCHGTGKVMADAEERVIGLPDDIDLEMTSIGATLVVLACPDCKGSGETDRVAVAFGKLGISLYYLKLLRTLPNLKIDITHCPECRIPFAFDGGEGLLMPMRLPKETSYARHWT